MNEALRVGKKTNIKCKDVYLSYNLCKYDSEGYADVEKYLPIEFDLCLVYCEGLKEPISAWYTGKQWDGLRYKSEKIIKWKRKFCAESHGVYDKY